MTTREYRPVEPTDLVRALTCPDAVLPTQFVATQQRRAPMRMAERALLLALLADAIECFCKHLRPKTAHQRQLFHEAETWMMREDEGVSRDASGNPQAFSFRYVCEVLGIDVAYLRGGLRRWRETQLRHARAR